MSQKITKARIMQRLISRFGLTRFNDEAFLLSETVIPVTILDSLLADGKVNLTTTSITGNGDFAVATVPTGKRWKLKILSTNRASGNYQFYRYRIKDVSQGNTMTVHVFTSTASETIKEFYQEIWMEEGDQVYVGCDTYVGTGNLSTALIYNEEDAY